MRRTRLFLAASGMVFTGALSSLYGCSLVSDFRSECLVNKEDGGVCVAHEMPIDAGNDGGQGGQIKPTCDGNPTDVDPATKDLKAFNKDCSIFVWAAAANPSAMGTMSDPLPKLQDAVDQAKGRWVIACNKDEIKENVLATNSVQIFGGYDCTDLKAWKRDAGKKTQLTGAMAGMTTLTLQNNGKDVHVTVQDLAITAPDASKSPPGTSSIAVAVDDLTAELTNCDVKAQEGAPGMDGQTPSDPVTAGAAAMMDALGPCLANVAGGTPGTTTCPDGISSGGAGGDGGQMSVDSGKGQPGKDGDGADMTHGKGGAGAPDSMTDCQPGLAGIQGDAGSDGMGGTSIGMLSLNGISGGDGLAGGPGKHGHGGGGGGGAVHGVFCKVGMQTKDGPGSSGGGGGAGGCGGKGGGAGTVGGSSIAIISLGAALKLTDVILTTGMGGKGGSGAGGQTGAVSGNGATGAPDSGISPSKAGCDGAKGGKGGGGGAGGGGRGGHSIGVLYQVSPTTPPIH